MQNFGLRLGNHSVSRTEFEVQRRRVGARYIVSKVGICATAFTIVLGLSACVPLPGPALAQPAAMTAMPGGLPVTATRVQWEDPPSPVGRLAMEVAAREIGMDPGNMPTTRGALYSLPDGGQLLLIQGGGYSGASTTGLGIFIRNPGGRFREAGTIGGSRSDEIPVTLVPQRGGYPALRVGFTQPSPYRPRLSMAEQRYRVVDHLVRYDQASGKYQDTTRTPG